MKKVYTMSTIAIVVAMIAVYICGCHGNKLETPTGIGASGQPSSFETFNSETYVWENWTIGTNTIEQIPQ